MAHTRIGLLHPGQMGSAVGRALVEAGHRVLWVSADRSPESRERAAQAGMEDAGTLEALVAQAEVILSICPPHAASEVAGQVAALGFTGIYTDCNAISPERTRAVETTIAGAGATYVDGGIVGGPPAGGPPRTWLYLSGAAADRVAACFPAEALHVVVLSERIGAASALKMCYAANTKGTSALFAAILALAEQAGVRDALERQWGESLTVSAHKRATDSALKAVAVSWARCTRSRRPSRNPACPAASTLRPRRSTNAWAPFKGRTEPPELGDVLDTLSHNTLSSMSISEGMLPEFDHEVAGVRTTLERVPSDKLDWKPHPASGSMGWLAGHLANLPTWAVLTIQQDDLDLLPGGKPLGQPPPPTDSAALVDTLRPQCRGRSGRHCRRRRRRPDAALVAAAERRHPHDHAQGGGAAHLRVQPSDPPPCAARRIPAAQRHRGPFALRSLRRRGPELIVITVAPSAAADTVRRS